MHTTRHRLTLALAGLGLVMSTLAIGCSDNNDLGEIDRPEFQLDEPIGAVFQLELPDKPNRPQLQTNKLSLRSTGKADLQITGIQWIDKPEGVYIQKKRNVVASCAADCQSDICIITGEQNTCVETGFPDLPLTIPAGQLYDIQMFIGADVTELDCAAPPADVPPAVGANYCGAIKITTNANNTGQSVENGSATIYLTKSGASGELRLTETFLQFTGVSPGFTATRTIGIENIGKAALTVSSIQPKKNGGFFTINGDFNTPIEPNSSKQYTIQLSIPTDATEEQLKFSTELEINSSAVNANQGTVVVSVTSSQGDVPQIKVDPTTLKFDQSVEQDLVVENIGGATLIVSSVSFEPSTLSDFYTVELNGAQFTSSENIQTPNAGDPDRNKRNFKVKFTRPAGNTASAAGIMYINHNDDASGKRTRVVLLGDAGDVPFAEVLPFSFSFDTGNDQNQTRGFAIINYGTAPLNITEVKPQEPALQGSNDEFQVNLAPVVIPPGGLYESSLLYNKVNLVEDNVVFKITSDTAGEPLQLNLVSVSNGGDVPVAKIKKSFVTNAKVGQVATFDATESSPSGAISGASWVLLSRPEGSKVFVKTFGKEIGITPDVAGTYRLALTVTDSAYDAQDILEFVAE